MTTPTNREAMNWIRVQQMAAQKKAQAERQAKVMAVMKPKQIEKGAAHG